MFRTDGRSRMYRRHNERYATNCVLEHDRFGGGGVVVWSDIRHDGRTALMRVNGALNDQIYQDEILQHHVVPLINVTGGIFQHDTARPHTVRFCGEFFLQIVYVQQDRQIYPQ